MTDLVWDFVRPRILSLGLKAEKKEKINFNIWIKYIKVTNISFFSNSFLLGVILCIIKYSVVVFLHLGTWNKN